MKLLKTAEIGSDERRAADNSGSDSVLYKNVNLQSCSERSGSTNPSSLKVPILFSYPSIRESFFEMEWFWVFVLLCLSVMNAVWSYYFI